MSIKNKLDDSNKQKQCNAKGSTKTINSNLLSLDVAQGCIKGIPNETQTDS